MPRGTVKWFSDKKGWGFLTDPEVQGDIFVHYSQIQGEGFRTLAEGDEVDYELFSDNKGSKARNVVRVQKSAPWPNLPRPAPENAALPNEAGFA